MAAEEEEEDLLDDSLEDLPADELNDLEQRAFDATQQQHQNQTANGDGDSDQQAPFYTLPTLPSTSLQQHRSHLQSFGPGHGQGDRSSDYGNLDDFEVDDDAVRRSHPSAVIRNGNQQATEDRPGQVTQREQWRLDRFGKTASYDRSRRPPLPPPQEETPPWVEAYDEEEDGIPPPDADAFDMIVEKRLERKHAETMGALQQRLDQLSTERDALQHNLHTATFELQSKTGEIAIIRANQAKALREGERKLTALQKLHADEIVRQRQEIDRAKAERERVSTENKFLKRDLTEEGERVRRLRRTGKGGDTSGTGAALNLGHTSASPLSTPKKTKALAYRDGFDDGEITISPSKVQTPTLKAPTPKAVSKRKRRGTEDSPGHVLQLSQPRRESEEDLQRGAIAAAGTFHRLKQDDGKFDFFQTMLNHRPSQTASRTFEALTQYALPSAPERSFASTIMDEMSLLGAIGPKEFPLGFCNIVLSMWSRCLEEKYYSPVSLVIELLTFAIAIDAPANAPQLVDTLLPQIQTTAALNAVPRHRRRPASAFVDGIDVHQCLDLLHMTALGCMHDEDSMRRYWQFMEWDFVIIMLHPNQHLEDISVMLGILSTSIFKDSLGPIVSSMEVDQQLNEKHILDRVALLLGEKPQWINAEEESDSAETAELRLEVLRLLQAMCMTTHGGQAMAKNSSVIGWLVRVMHDELDALYDFHDGQEHSAQQVNISTLLLYRLTTTYGPHCDLQASLATVPGGQHKHLVGLTRLAFSQGLVLEAGIDDEVGECAHQMLEDAVTPETGEALVAAFTGANR
ncbi:MAG: hypothetical protein M1833_000201 [Piccolia ochrophora]|nr:MAG: hypothetical protein M1833_000201 [Piccolia ochrophora]